MDNNGLTSAAPFPTIPARFPIESSSTEGRAREEQLDMFAKLTEKNPLWSQRRCIDRAFIELMKQPSAAQRFCMFR